MPRVISVVMLDITGSAENVAISCQFLDPDCSNIAIAMAIIIVDSLAPLAGPP
jgi:hypothetical protein